MLKWCVCYEIDLSSAYEKLYQLSWKFIPTKQKKVSSQVPRQPIKQTFPLVI